MADLLRDLKEGFWFAKQLLHLFRNLQSLRAFDSMD